MKNRQCIKISLLVCLSLGLFALMIIFVVMAIMFTQLDKDQKSVSIILIVAVIFGITTVIQILGIVAVSRDHYCGSLAFTILQGIMLLSMIARVITEFDMFSIILLLSSIVIFSLCVKYVRQLRQSQTKNSC